MHLLDPYSSTKNNSTRSGNLGQKTLTLACQRLTRGLSGLTVDGDLPAACRRLAGGFKNGRRRGGGDNSAETEELREEEED